MKPALVSALSAAIALTGASCVEVASLQIPAPPPTSRSMLLIRSCGPQLEIRASSLPLPDLALLETNCERERLTWVAHLPRALESYGWEVGVLSTEACPNDVLACCVQRALEEVEFDALHEGGEDTVSQEILAWPDQLSALSLRAKCACSEIGDIAQLELPGVERARVAPLDDEQILVLTFERHADDRPSTSIHVLGHAALSGRELTLGAAELGTYPLQPFTIDTDLRGNIAVGTATNAVLFGNLESGLQFSPRLAPDRNSRIVRMRPGAGAGPEFALLSELHPTEFHLYRDGRWTSFGDPELMRGSCRGGLSNNGQRPEILWLGPDELLVMPHSIDWLPDETPPQPTTHPHGFWHLKDQVLRWVRGPAIETDCLTALGFVPKYGVVVGTREGAIHAWDGEQWEVVEFSYREGPPMWGGDVFEIFATPLGFMFGGREGYISYSQEGVLCANFKPSLLHLRSAVSFADQIVIGTDDRANEGAAHLLRLRLSP